MNITFARHLIERAEDSMDTLLSWSSQHLQEPPLGADKPTEQLDFYGAYGRYFVELFLYLPWLVAHRFNQERQFSEAERWLLYLFNPARKAVSGGNPDYWNAVPLISGPPKPGQSSYALQGPKDPHQIALSHPVHFRKALYVLYIDILVNRGDAAYRELSPDSLTDAKLWYLRAQRLLGPRPDLRQTDLWAALTLKTFSEEHDKKLRECEVKVVRDGKHQLMTSAPALAPEVCVRPYVPSHFTSLIDTPHSRLPERTQSSIHSYRNSANQTTGAALSATRQCTEIAQGACCWRPVTLRHQPRDLTCAEHVRPLENRTSLDEPVCAALQKTGRQRHLRGRTGQC
jgi:hypothetical protein